MAFNFSPKIVTNGLVLHLDAASRKSYVSGSTVWNDLSRSRNNGTLVNGPTFDSANGGNIVFDGTNDYINVPANQSNILTTLTMECWFNASGLPNGDYHVLFQKEGGYSGGSVYGLRVTPGSTFYAMIAYSAGLTDLKTLFSTTSLVNGRWYHVASTLDSLYNWKIYINGVSENSTTLTSFPFQNSSDINIGTGDNRYTNGKIANLKVYNTTLSAQEILQNYNATKGRYGL